MNDLTRTKFEDVAITFEATEEAYKRGDLVNFTKHVQSDLVSQAWMLAECLYLLKKTVILEEGVKFNQWASTEFNIRPETAKRYVDVWTAMIEAPETVRLDAINKKINALIPLGTNIANGKIEPDEVDWDKIKDVQTNTDMYDMIHEIRGTEREQRDRSERITIKESAWGDIVAYYKNEQYMIGSITQDEDLPEFAKVAVERVRNAFKGQ